MHSIQSLLTNVSAAPVKVDVDLRYSEPLRQLMSAGKVDLQGLIA